MRWHVEANNPSTRAREHVRGIASAHPCPAHALPLQHQPMQHQPMQHPPILAAWLPFILPPPLRRNCQAKPRSLVHLHPRVDARQQPPLELGQHVDLQHGAQQTLMSTLGVIKHEMKAAAPGT